MTIKLKLEIINQYIKYPIIKIICYITIYICSINSFLYAIPTDSYITNIWQNKDGLPHNNVWCLIQDSYGFAWIGTNRGLCCYDGRRTIKLHTFSDNEGIEPDNMFVRSLFEDNHKRIWIGTDCGIYIYDRIKGISRFKTTTSFGVNISCEVRKIIRISNTSFLIATLGQGFFVYDEDKDTLAQYNCDTSFVLDAYYIEKKIYVSTLWEGVLCFNENLELIESYKPAEEINGTDAHSIRLGFIQFALGSLWIGGDGRDLFELSLTSNKIERHYLNENDFQTVRCITPLDKNKILLGTNNGIFIYNIEDKSVSSFKYADNIPKDVNLCVNNFINDNEGGTWILTERSGIIHISPRKKQFDNCFIAGDNIVNSFCQGFDHNKVWIGTQKGLYLYDIQTKDLKEYLISDSNNKYDIRTLCASEGELWIGTASNGLKVIRLSDKKIKSYTHSYNTPNTVLSNNIQKIQKCRDGEIYIGTNWGLCIYNPSLDNFRPETSVGAMVSITDIYEDSRNNVWIGTATGGIYRRDKNTNRWTHYEYDAKKLLSLPGNSITSIFEDRNGNLYIGTNGSGLCLFDYKNEHFIKLTNNEELFSSVISSIQQDTDGSLWVSTASGLCRIDPLHKSNYKYFTYRDGLKRSYYAERSSFCAYDGTLFFGGTSGFNTFMPSHFKNNTFTPPVYITDIEFARTESNTEVYHKIKKHNPLYLTKEIKVPYDYNSFTIFFSALSYTDPEKNLFSYKMEGLDEEWSNNIKNTSVTYRNLTPGKYCFLLKGANNDGVWNGKIAKLHILITPPWYMSIWAYCIYSILLVSIIVYTLTRREKYLKDKYSKSLIKYREEKEKELYKNKVNFFINLIHEIRTPLTLIKLPLDSLVNASLTDEVRNKYLSVMNKNVNYLLGITNELLDFQKMESGEIKLSLAMNDIVQLTYEICQQFAGSAEIRGIELYEKTPANLHINVLIDRDKIDKILVNLLSNAMKYTSSQIIITINTDNNNVYICVEDDGPGIKEEEKEKIFQVFYQSSGHKLAPGTGIGLAYARTLAESHHGTLTVKDSNLGGAAFILSIPLYKECAIEKESTSLTDIEIDNNENSTVDDKLLQKTHTVLLVEDNPELLDMESSSLNKWFNVLKANNGIQALKIIENHDVDIVVSDVMMPIMDGLELCSKIKENISYSHIPVVLLTAKTLPEAKVEGFISGADAYMEKPFTIMQLCMQIRNLLKLRNLFQQHISSHINDKKSTNSEYPEGAVTPKDIEFLKKMDEKIDISLSNEKFSIDSLAADMNMSRSNFYRKLKSLSGMSPNDYLKNYRLNRAAQMLMEGYRITEVFEQTGFCSSSYFAKCFKAKYGVLPKDFQNNTNDTK